MRGAVHVDPINGQALQACNSVAHFIVEDFRAASWNGIQPSIAQAADRVVNSQPAVFGDGDDLRCRIAM